jgi:transcriptional regulator NrdR family protein
MPTTNEGTRTILCPVCHSDQLKLVAMYSAPTETRRAFECMNCHKFETVETVPVGDIR